MEPTPSVHRARARAASDPGWERAWTEALASHVARRFETRALVSVAVNGRRPVALSYVYAIDGGGLVLVIDDADEHDHDHDDHTEGEGGQPSDDAQVRAELWDIYRGTGTNEIWISSPEQAVFYARRAEEGQLSTGFGVLGLSRTPDLIVPRSAVTPVREKGHEHP